MISDVVMAMMMMVMVMIDGVDVCCVVVEFDLQK